MSDALFAVQQALFNALAPSTEVQSFLGNPPRLYDHVPPGAAFPYAAFGPVHATAYDNKSATGFEHIVTINVWSRYRGSKEAKDILQALYDTLHRATLTVAGQVFISCEFHSADVTADSDGLTTQASAHYSILTQSS